MNRILSIFFFLLTTTAFAGAGAQDLHFIYLQSEQKQPFYIRSEGKVYSSSDAGFVIIPQLREGTFSFTLGFPKNKWAAQNYQLDIAGRDVGFQLKKVDELNWALYDIQTNELLSALAQPTANAPYVTLINDEFTNVLAEVSNTPSIKEKKWEAPPEVKPNVTATPLPVTDTATKHIAIQSDSLPSGVVAANNAKPIADTAQMLTATTVDTSTAAIDTTTITIVEGAQPSKEQQDQGLVEKIYDEKSDSGRVMKFIVQGADGKEEVSVLIPEMRAEKENAVVKDTLNADTTALSPPLPEVKKEDNVPSVVADTVATANANPVVDVPQPLLNDTVAALAINADTVTLANQIDTKLKSNCISAEEKDLIMLRRKMVAEDSEEKMLDVALENMKEKCFNTDQMRHLAALFLEEGRRVAFLEKAYVYCSNKADYGKLRNLLNDAIHLERFNQLLQ